MNTTAIEWTDKTWNPVTGCTKVSQGCKYCYAERVFPRAYGKDRKFTDVQCHPDRLEQPIHWRKPARIFVNSMSDLFHEDVPFHFIDDIHDRMIRTAHTYQVLTKRPNRAFQYYDSTGNRAEYLEKLDKQLWLGTSVENQETYVQRWPVLRQIPAVVLFLSVEPMLENIWLQMLGSIKNPDWIIVGGESGPNDRPMHPDWARSIRDQCKAAGIPFFFKQWGETIHRDAMTDEQFISIDAVHNLANTTQDYWRIGKKAAGRILDGREWNEYPSFGATS